jgi:hypothetical protein
LLLRARRGAPVNMPQKSSPNAIGTRFLARRLPSGIAIFAPRSDLTFAFLGKSCQTQKPQKSRERCRDSVSPRLRRGVALRGTTSTGMATDPPAEPGAASATPISVGFCRVFKERAQGWCAKIESGKVRGQKRDGSSHFVARDGTLRGAPIPEAVGLRLACHARDGRRRCGCLRSGLINSEMRG